MPRAESRAVKSAPRTPPRRSGKASAPNPHNHGARVVRAKADVLQGQGLTGVTELFRALGDPTRVRLLSVLAGGEACVFDLAEALEMTSSAISHQLRVLRTLRLVRNRRDGREIYYALDDEHVVGLIESAREHLQHDRPNRGARRRAS
jgi:ArsR family transcriptional regulator, lead/cadmium/zinc/bismuth-responsive transcriptional repressor